MIRTAFTTTSRKPEQIARLSIGDYVRVDNMFANILRDPKVGGNGCGTLVSAHPSPGGDSIIQFDGDNVVRAVKLSECTLIRKGELRPVCALLNIPAIMKPSQRWQVSGMSEVPKSNDDTPRDDVVRGFCPTCGGDLVCVLYWNNYEGYLTRYQCWNAILPTPTCTQEDFQP